MLPVLVVKPPSSTSNTDGVPVTVNLRALRKAMDALDARVTYLEKLMRPEPVLAAPSQLALAMTVARLAVRVSCLEHEVHVTHDSDLSNVNICPVHLCTRSYKRSGDLTKHILQSHTAFTHLAVQTKCDSCHTSFSSSVGLIKHEKEAHAELYRARIEMYKPFLRQCTCKYHVDIVL